MIYDNLKHPGCDHPGGVFPFFIFSKKILGRPLNAKNFGQKIDLKSIWVKIDFTLPLNENTQKNKNTTKLPPFQLP